MQFLEKSVPWQADVVFSTLQHAVDQLSLDTYSRKAETLDKVALLSMKLCDYKKVDQFVSTPGE